jgi:hypothetical protein
MKTLKDIIKEATSDVNPLPGRTKNFIDKHTVQKIDYPVDAEDQFTAKKIKKDHSKGASYKEGEDNSVYEETDAEKTKKETMKTFPNVKHFTKSGHPDWEKHGIKNIPTVKEATKHAGKISAVASNDEREYGDKAGRISAELDKSPKKKVTLPKAPWDKVEESYELDEALTDKRVTTTDSEHKKVVGDLHRKLTSAGYKPQFQSTNGSKGFTNGTMDHLSNPNVAKDKSVIGHVVKYKNDNGHTVNMTIRHKGNIRDDRGDKTENIQREVSISKLNYFDAKPKKPNLPEETMSDAETAKRENIVKSMKKNTQGFKDRYGDRWKSVMYATATKNAMKETMDPVGKEDADVDNNGKVNASDKYLKNRRKAISAKIKESVDLDEAFKVGALKLKDGSSVSLTKESAEALNGLFNQLNSSNKSKMEEKLMSDSTGFDEILAFAKEV